MEWTNRRSWKKLELECPRDISDMAKLGKQVEHALVQLDRGKYSITDDGIHYVQYMNEHIRRPTTRISKQFLRLIQTGVDSDDPDTRGKIQAVKNEIGLRKRKLNNLHNNNIAKHQNPNAGALELYRIGTISLYEGLIYDALKQAISVHNQHEHRNGDDEDDTTSFPEILLDEAFKRCDTLEPDTFTDISDEDREQMSDEVAGHIESAEDLDQKIQEIKDGVQI